METPKMSAIYIYNLYRDLELLNDSFSKMKEMNTYVSHTGKALSLVEIRSFLSAIARFLQNATNIKIKMESITSEFDRVKSRIEDITTYYDEFANDIYGGSEKHSIDNNLINSAENFVKIVNETFYSGVKADIGKLGSNLLKGGL